VTESVPSWWWDIGGRVEAICLALPVVTVFGTMWSVQERQRTVIVIASGLGLALVATTVNRLLSDPGGGWFAYAPNTGATFPPGSDTGIWREAGIWLGALAVWTGLALWLYRHPRQRS
jgi:hypothetical protein